MLIEVLLLKKKNVFQKFCSSRLRTRNINSILGQLEKLCLMAQKPVITRHYRQMNRNEFRGNSVILSVAIGTF